MQKLFVKPEHGNLGKVVEKLRAEDFKVEIVGWGYPPMYVVADKGEHDEIKEIVLELDPKAEFALYRANLIERDQMIDILQAYEITDLQEVCARTGDSFVNLNAQANGRVQGIALQLITEHEKADKLEQLVEAAYKSNEPLFLKAMNKGD